MVFKPLPVKKFEQYIKLAGWSLKKGSVDWKLYDDKGAFLCAIKIAHGKRTKEEVVAHSVNKVKQLFTEKGLLWPPRKK